MLKISENIILLIYKAKSEDLGYPPCNVLKPCTELIQCRVSSLTPPINSMISE